MITFGPELIGRTEKTLGALLHRSLADTGLDEREYVTLRVASTLTSQQDLIAEVRGRAHFADAPALVVGLTERGLLENGRLSVPGANLLEQVLDRTASRSARIWTDFAAEDLAVATRVLNSVLDRAEAALIE